jgi:hypothetical protein
MQNKYFKKEIYDDLPDLLKKLVGEFSEREKDVVLLSSLGVLSNCIPNVMGYYDKKKHFSHLYTMVIAPPASGKGSMGYSSILIDKIHQHELNKSRSKIKNWGKEKIGKCPSLDVKILPGNVSSSKFYSHMKENEHGLLIFESEADSISNMLKQDWGNFSDILRKAYHHEKISISREIDDKFIEVESPKLSMVISGTPGQVKPLVLSTENGLFSRFLYYYFDDGIEWKDVTPTDNFTDYTTVFKNSSNDIYELYVELEKVKEPIEFQFTDEQWEKLNCTLKNATTIFLDNGLSSLSSSVFRNGLNLFRIAMVLSVLRNIDTITDNQKLICADIDFEISHSIIKYLLDHVILVSEIFKKDKFGLSVYDLNILSNLPKKFKRDEAIKIAGKLEIKTRTMDGYLKKWKIKNVIKPVKPGYYEKILNNVNIANVAILK